jgi:hypothetical protein
MATARQLADQLDTDPVPFEKSSLLVKRYTCTR